MTFECIQRRASRGGVRDVTTRADHYSRDLPYRVGQRRDAKIGCSFSYANHCDHSPKKGHFTGYINAEVKQKISQASA